MAKLPASTGYFNKDMQKILKGGNSGKTKSGATKKTGSKKK